MAIGRSTFIPVLSNKNACSATTQNHILRGFSHPRATRRRHTSLRLWATLFLRDLIRPVHTLKDIFQPKVAIALFTFTVLALAIHGYHPYAEDAEIYLPGVEKALQPALFPVGTGSFEAYANASLFPKLIASSVRLTHLPLPYALFAWHLVSVFLLLLGCWELSGKCFEDTRARLGAVLLIATL